MPLSPSQQKKSNHKCNEHEELAVQATSGNVAVSPKSLRPNRRSLEGLSPPLVTFQSLNVTIDSNRILLPPSSHEPMSFRMAHQRSLAPSVNGKCLQMVVCCSGAVHRMDAEAGQKASPRDKKVRIRTLHSPRNDYDRYTPRESTFEHSWARCDAQPLLCKALLLFRAILALLLTADVGATVDAVPFSPAGSLVEFLVTLLSMERRRGVR